MMPKDSKLKRVKHDKLVSYIVPWYRQVPVAVFSLLAQTYSNIEIILAYDGVVDVDAARYIQVFNDPKIKFFSTTQRYNDWGHTPRNLGIDKLSVDSTAVVFTGADNYYLPSFTTELISALYQDAQTAAVYCDMLHNGTNWNTVNTRLQYSHIDCGCFMVKPDIAREFRWGNSTSWEDWIFIEKVINKYTISAIKKVSRALYVHN